MLREYHAERTTPAQGHGKQAERRVFNIYSDTLAKQPEPPVTPYTGWGSDEGALLAFAAPIGLGPRATMGPDELYQAPAPGVLDRIRDAFTFETFAPVLRTFADREWVRSDDLIAALRADGQIKGEVTDPRIHHRITKAMAKLGFQKGEVQANGERLKAFKKERAAA